MDSFKSHDQIYHKVWNEYTIGNEKNAVKCHIRNIREKLDMSVSKAPFEIRCIREVRAQRCKGHKREYFQSKRPFSAKESQLPEKAGSKIYAEGSPFCRTCETVYQDSGTQRQDH